jgi:hypothetical protein
LLCPTFTINEKLDKALSTNNVGSFILSKDIIDKGPVILPTFGVTICQGTAFPMVSSSSNLCEEPVWFSEDSK